MKTRMLCLLVCVAMVMLLLPAAAFAQPGEKADHVWIFGQLLESGAVAMYYHNGSEDGDIGYTNNDKTGFNAYFDDYTATLTLNNLRVKDSDATKDGINYAVYADGDLTIILCDESVISTVNNGNQMTAALYVDGNLTVKNEPIDEYHTFIATAQGNSGSSSDTIEQYGVYVTGKLKIDGKANLCGKVTGNVIAGDALSVGVRANTVEIAGEQKALLEGNTAGSHADASRKGISYGIQAVHEDGLTVTSGRVLGASGQVSGKTENGSYGIHAAAIRVENRGALMATRPDIGVSESSAALSCALTQGAGIGAKGLTVDSTAFVPYEASDNPYYMQVKTSHVMVSPESCDMRKGIITQFTAQACEGTNLDDPVQTDNWRWTVEGGVADTTIDADSGCLMVARYETAETLTVKATSKTDSTFFGTAIVTSQPITVYNDSKHSDATIWLTGEGLDSGDLVYTKRDPQGSAYEALTRLANGKDVVGIYDIFLRSKIKSTGHPMKLTFDLNKEFPGQAFTAGESFTLVHQLANRTYEYFYEAAELNTKHNVELTFGPLYVLSPFMLVKGTLAPPTPPTPTDPPRTGDNAPLALLLGAMLMAATALAGVIIYRRRMN